VKFDKAVGRAAEFLRDAAVAALAFMMSLTVADIVLRWVANAPIFGAFELVELSLVSLVFLAIPIVCAKNKHIVINVLDETLPRPVLRWLDVCGMVAALCLVSLIGIYMIGFARDAYRFGDRTMDMGMPVVWFWVPVFLGVLVSVAVCLSVSLRLLRQDQRR